MKFVDNVKLLLGEKLLEREIKKTDVSPKKYSEVFGNAIDVSFLLPEDNLFFSPALDVARFVKIHKKNVTLILPDHKKNLLADSFDYQFVTYNQTSVSQLGVVSSSFGENLKKKRFDIFIDLTCEETLFYRSLALNVAAEIKMALFGKEKSEKIYNLLFDADKTNYEKSYRNLLNSLQMF